MNKYSYIEELDPFMPFNKALDTFLSRYDPDYFSEELNDEDIEKILLSADPNSMSQPIAFNMFIDYYINELVLSEIAIKYNETKSNIKLCLKKIRPDIEKYVREKAIEKGKIVPKYTKPKYVSIPEAFNKPGTVLESVEIITERKGKPYKTVKKVAVKFSEDSKFREKRSYGGKGNKKIR
jgi:predicted DNA-binding protein YlxM (UPF0122 family)